MRTRLFLQLAVTLSVAVQLSACAYAPRSSAETASSQIVQLDPRFDKLVPRDAKLEKIAREAGVVAG